MSDKEAGSPEPAANSPVDDRHEADSIRDDGSNKGDDAASNGRSSPEEDEARNGVDDDNDSILSELPEDDIADYDPATANIEDRPVDIDEDVARTLKASKRKTTDGEKRKPKEGRRDKRRRDDDVDANGEGDRRPRKRRGATATGERQRKDRTQSPPEPQLTPEERRARALSKQLDAAVKGPTKRRRRKAEDLDDPVDEQIQDLVIRMENACVADNKAREEGQSASQKVAMIDEVVSMLNRNTAQDAVLDPDTGFLKAVRFFLEPLSDGSLPAYDIQNKIFMQLDRLPIGKDQLLGSGMGKVVFFYTKSKRPVPRIKRMANKLVEDWSRPILKRTNDYKKRQVEEREYDYQAAKLAQRGGSQITLSQRSGPSQHEIERERALAQDSHLSLARAPGLPTSYSIAPKSTLSGPQSGMAHRPVGATGIDAFRRMTSKPKKR